MAKKGSKKSKVAKHKVTDEEGQEKEGEDHKGKGTLEKKKPRRKRNETWVVYIYKVLKQVHPDTGIGKRAMAVMNSAVQDIFERMGRAAGDLTKMNKKKKKKTIQTREVQTGLKLLMPGELVKHAISEGTKAVSKFNS